MRYPAWISLIYFIFSLSHASSLKELTIADPLLGTRHIIYEELNGYGIVEGDIILSSIKKLKHQGAMVVPTLSSLRWPHNTIAYEIDDDVPMMNKIAISQAINHWEKQTNIRFVALNTENRTDYEDYISFVRALDGITCASYVGKQGGRQVIILAPRCGTMNTVHEIGHTLGLWHEQSRIDRDSFIRILWENIEESHQFNFIQHISDGSDFGDYDYQSIMHYGPYAFSKNGKKTIVPLVEGIEIGQRYGLSEKDIAAIMAMYPEMDS